MAIPTHDHSHLWNDLPQAERERLMPYMLEHEMLIVWQEKQKAVRAHKAHMKLINEKLDCLNAELKKLTNQR